MKVRRADVRALTFDIFGAVVVWRPSVIREGELLGAMKPLIEGEFDLVAADLPDLARQLEAR